VSLALTISLLVAFASFSAMASWRASKPATHKPRMAPWRLLFILSGATALYMLVHLLNLFGVTTGQTQPAS
jgi:amino acid transporter